MKTITKGWRYLILLGVGSMLMACNPARYTYLRKVDAKSADVKTIASVEKEQMELMEEKEPSVPIMEEQDPVLASVDMNHIVLSKRPYSAHKAIRSTVSEKENLVNAALIQKKVAKKLSHFKRKDTVSRQGLLWSLIAAVVVVWLVGVLFTNVGGLVHVLLAVALILVIMNLLL